MTPSASARLERLASDTRDLLGRHDVVLPSVVLTDLAKTILAHLDAHAAEERERIADMMDKGTLTGAAHPLMAKAIRSHGKQA